MGNEVEGWAREISAMSYCNTGGSEASQPHSGRQPPPRQRLHLHNCVTERAPVSQPRSGRIVNPTVGYDSQRAFSIV